MASSNKTAHYELSQYSATDKPTYMGDYNTDMDNIDSGIYDAQTTADSAQASATIADGKATQAQSDATTALNSAGSANTKIGDLANLNTTDKSSVVKAINENKRNIDNFNLSIFETATNISCSGGNLDAQNSNVSVAKNSDGSLAKIYGNLRSTPVSGSGRIIYTFQTSLRPTQDITINNVFMSRLINNNTYFTASVFVGSITIKTTGEVETAGIAKNGTENQHDIYLMPMLLFIKDFGDTPTPE